MKLEINLNETNYNSKNLYNVSKVKESGLFINTDENNVRSVVYCNEDGALMFIDMAAAFERLHMNKKGIIEKNTKKDIKINKADGGYISEDGFLKSIAILLNKEKLQDLNK